MKQKINMQCLALGVPGTGKTTELRKRVDQTLLDMGFTMKRHSHGIHITTPRVFVHDPASFINENSAQWPEIMGIPVKPYDPEESFPFVRFQTVDGMLSAPRDGDTILLFDELMLVEKEHYKELQDLSVLRRHHRVAIFAGSQRPAKIPKEFLSLSNSILVFNLHDVDDLQKLKSLLSKEELQAVPKLKQGQYIEFTGV